MCRTHQIPAHHIHPMHSSTAQLTTIQHPPPSLSRQATQRHTTPSLTPSKPVPNVELEYTNTPRRGREGKGGEEATQALAQSGLVREGWREVPMAGSISACAPRGRPSPCWRGAIPPARSCCGGGCPACLKPPRTPPPRNPPPPLPPADKDQYGTRIRSGLFGQLRALLGQDYVAGEVAQRPRHLLTLLHLEARRLGSA
jgi:hypothetical protein